MMIYVLGHRNPDTDSVVAAITLSMLKNKLGDHTEPRVVGSLNQETEYVLDYFQVPPPQKIDNVKTQLRDLNYERVEGIDPRKSILYAYQLMARNNIKVLPIIDRQATLLGIVTMKDIAMGLIKGDFYGLTTKMGNIVEALEGELLAGEDEEIEGTISVISYYYDTMVKGHLLDEKSIVIVGDRYDVIEHAIKHRVKLIIVTGGKTIPAAYIAQAKENGVNLILVKLNTYATAKLLNQCNYVASIMKIKDIVKFNENEYLDEVREELITNRHSRYPVVTGDNQYLGFVGRRHILNPRRKKVILVDHNEYAQGVEGLAEAEIIEIVDHHRIGDILTTAPIVFRNMPVGSTCTIVFNLFRESNVALERKTAGLLLAGIISDTLALKSPTTTPVDKEAVAELTQLLDLDATEFAREMFKAGTSLEGQSVAEIFQRDFKEFSVRDYKIGIGQVFTLDFEDIFRRQNEFLEFMNNLRKKNNYYLVLFLVTDILKNGSYFLFQCTEQKMVNTIFNRDVKQGVFLPDVVSRKKQVAPLVMEALDRVCLGRS